ncbi:putative cobalamin biosynthesis protein, CobT [Caballeronia pedi]|uniref:Cobalamin biosynthesis protein, CobT n=1 Tax=Caballeronia pedi TaxID=1777141 RepID=A0A158D790_9BURK|nr:cobalamin biosynthesis protein CobT [Caballeronia pedi]SAK90341.1 putative cobalamin biosynthesis protein, CobT [Caballeronia pedi]
MNDDASESLARLARTLAHRHDVQVRFASDGPALRGDVIVLPGDLADAASADAAIGYIDMLAARRRFCDLNALAEADASTGFVAEVLEDRRVCERLIDAYPGTVSFLSAMRAQRETNIHTRWHDLSWRDRLRWRIERLLWNEQPSAMERSPTLDAAVNIASDVLRESPASESTQDSVCVASRLVERVRALWAGGINTMMFAVDKDDTPDLESSADSSLSPTSDPFAEPSDGEAAPPPSQRAHIGRPVRSIPITTAFDRIADLTGKGDPGAWRKLRSAARAQTEPLKARLERALKADEQTHWRREQERGELDRPSLARLATAPGYRTPFRLAHIRPGRDAAVTLLIDRSGSMAGRKIELARLCAAAIGDALVQLGFAAEILGYSSIEDPAMRDFHARWLAEGHAPHGYNRFVERLDFEVYKRFDSENMSGLARIECGHENPDGEALSWAADRLLARRAHRRILMVLQDGYPATGDGDPAILRSDLRARIGELSGRGIELIGVGILDDAVETFYPRSIVVEQIQQLPTAAFDALGQTLLSRR